MKKKYKTGKELINAVIDNGTLWNSAGDTLSFDGDSFELVDEHGVIMWSELALQEWSTLEPIKQFDVLWRITEDSAQQIVFYELTDKGVLRRCDFINEEITIVNYAHCAEYIKCLPEEIRPNVAEFREKCLEVWRGRERGVSFPQML